MHSIAYVSGNKLRIRRIKDMRFIIKSHLAKDEAIKLYFPADIPYFAGHLPDLLVCCDKVVYLFKDINYQGSDYSVGTTQLSYKSMIQKWK